MCIRDRACGVNGHRSMVIDLSKTDPDGFADEDRPKLADPMSMVTVSYTHLDVYKRQTMQTSRSVSSKENSAIPVT